MEDPDQAKVRDIHFDRVEEAESFGGAEQDGNEHQLTEGHVQRREGLPKVGTKGVTTQEIT